MSENVTTHIGYVLAWSWPASVLCVPVLASGRRPVFFVPFFFTFLVFAVAAWFGPGSDIPLVFPAILMALLSGGGALLLFRLVRWVKGELAYRGIIDWIDPYEMDDGKLPTNESSATSGSASEPSPPHARDRRENGIDKTYSW